MSIILKRKAVVDTMPPLEDSPRKRQKETTIPPYEFASSLKSLIKNTNVYIKNNPDCLCEISDIVQIKRNCVKFINETLDSWESAKQTALEQVIEVTSIKERFTKLTTEKTNCSQGIF